MTELSIGQSIPRYEDLRLLRGGGAYLDDLAFPRLCFGAVLRSQHAHAVVLGIDKSKAEAAPGVLAVLTGADWLASGFGHLPTVDGFMGPDGRPSYQPRCTALATDRVRWEGDCVAFVVAETMLQALDALELIEVDYDLLPAVVSASDAVAPGAPLLWEDCPGNICFARSDGDEAATDAAFLKADHVVKHRLAVNRVTAASMEPRGAVGNYDARTGRFSLFAGVQHPHALRSSLSRFVLNVPETKIRVVSPDVGGSFGMKAALYHEAACVLLASKLLQRPVKWISTRSEAFLSDAHGRDHVFDAELALSRRGDMLAMRVTSLAAVGAWLQPFMPAYYANLGGLAGVYRIPAMHLETRAVFTNTSPIGPYRGNGRPEASYVIERLIDIAADELGIDAAEIRRRNYIPSEAMPFATALTFTYDSGEFAENMARALALADADAFETRRAAAGQRGKLAGLGIANVIERAAAPSLEGAEIRFDRSGNATIFSGSVAHGQGHETTFKQVVCARLGLDPEFVAYVQGDTDLVAFGEGTDGSRSATMSGAAFAAAADKVVGKATSIAAHLLALQPGQVRFDKGLFYGEGTNRTLTLKDVAASACDPTNLPDGLEGGLSATAVHRAVRPNFPNGCHVCEVEIDEETGVVQVVRYVVVDDIGTVLNPLLAHGQLVGGVAQGIGQVLMENIAYDADGQLLTGSFMDYAMPRAADIGPIAIENNPVWTTTNPLGTKGAGEAGCVGALPAVTNAILDALSGLGVKQIELPATSERLWRIIRDARQGPGTATRAGPLD